MAKATVCKTCNGKGYLKVNKMLKKCPDCKGRSLSSHTPPIGLCPYCKGLGVYRSGCCDVYKPCPLCSTKDK